MIEENVVSAAGAHFRLSEAQIARAIQDAGFVPKRRTMDYQIVATRLLEPRTPTLPGGHARGHVARDVKPSRAEGREI